jgi:MYXO-CTERM domain-containing protein
MAVRLLLVVVLALVLAPAAAAGELIDAAVESLRDDPVYVHPDAERRISDAEAARIREAIADEGAGPLYVAILPERARNEAGGDANGVLRALREAMGIRATYAVVVGNSFRAGSDLLPAGTAGEAADDAFAESGDEGVEAVLVDFVGRVGEERRGDGESDGGGFPNELLLVGAAGVGGLLLYRRRRRASERKAELAEVKQEAEADLLALAEDVRALDLDVEMPGADPRAKEDYARALTAYEDADRQLDRARSTEELEPVSRALEEGRYAMASAKARLQGREPPERTPPCFFDPRHGPSVEDVEWAPPGGEPRPVPVCAADAARIRDGLEPESREVLVGGERRPYWAAGPAYAPYAGGFFGGFGGLLPGLLLGSALSGPMFGGFGGDSGDGRDGGFGDFGDSGGGGFGDFGGGGGDFGGGDFGGGGGDFGGGGD